MTKSKGAPGRVRIRVLIAFDDLSVGDVGVAELTPALQALADRGLIAITQVDDAHGAGPHGG